MDWAYGITTVPERQFNYLPRTIESLKNAGFDLPTLFVDGSNSKSNEFEKYNLPVVYRSSKIRAYGNWLLGLMELWIRNPHADKYAMFQDDFVTYKNLRTYLDSFETGNEEYLNLLTFPQNEAISKGIPGWFPSNQRGRGAVALVFNRHVLLKLLGNELMLAKPAAKRHSDRSIDGVLVTAMNKIGIREKVHYPTLVFHIGDCSSIGNRQHVKPTSFKGEDFDAIELIV